MNDYIGLIGIAVAALIMGTVGLVLVQKERKEWERKKQLKTTVRRSGWLWRTRK